MNQNRKKNKEGEQNKKVLIMSNEILFINWTRIRFITSILLLFLGIENRSQSLKRIMASINRFCAGSTPTSEPKFFSDWTIENVKTKHAAFQQLDQLRDYLAQACNFM